ncbi:hypothetical protein SprV_0602187000 [Sparganum proliferum]
MLRCGQATRDFKDANIFHFYKLKAFSRLQDSAWNSHSLLLKIELKIYKAVVLTTLLYGAEIWTVYSSCARRLNVFYHSCLRRILRLRWLAKFPDTEVLERVGILSVHDTPRQLQFRRSRHLLRMDDARLSKQLFSNRCSPTGRTKTTLKGHIEELSQATVYQSRDLGGPGPEQTWLEKRRQAHPSANQTKSPLQKPRGLLASFRRPRVTTSPLNPIQRAALSTNISRTRRSRQSSLDPMHQPPDDRNCSNLHVGFPSYQSYFASPVTLPLATTTSFISATTPVATSITTISATTANDQNTPDALTTTNIFSIITPTSSNVGSVGRDLGRM